LQTCGKHCSIDAIVQKVAELRSISSEELVALVQTNLLNLIGDDPWFRDSHLALLINEENNL
jgi:hypothetical protein